MRIVVDEITLGCGVLQVLWLCSVIIIPQMLHTHDPIENSVGNRGLGSTKTFSFTWTLSLSLSLSLSLLASHVFLLITEADHLRLRTACVPVGGVEKQGHLEARENWLDRVIRWGINRVGHVECLH